MTQNYQIYDLVCKRDVHVTNITFYEDCIASEYFDKLFQPSAQLLQFSLLALPLLTRETPTEAHTGKRKKMIAPMVKVTFHSKNKEF